MNHLLQFLFVLIAGDEAPFAYVIGIALSVIGGILMSTTERVPLMVLGLAFIFFGIIILLFKIRKDIKE